jgi:hypothetical protein
MDEINYKLIAKRLWDILDDISCGFDHYKPDMRDKFVNYVSKKIEERNLYANSPDGQTLTFQKDIPWYSKNLTSTLTPKHRTQTIAKAKMFSLALLNVINSNLNPFGSAGVNHKFTLMVFKLGTDLRHRVNEAVKLNAVFQQRVAMGAIGGSGAATGIRDRKSVV